MDSKKIKNKAGVICDIAYTRSIAMSRNFYCIQNLFESCKIVNSELDLRDIEILFISDPFFNSHRNIWTNNNFISNCNDNNIKVVLFFGEKIYNSVFPDAQYLFNLANKFNNMTYYLWDADDSIIYKRDILRYCPSRYFENSIPKKQKINKCLFVGQINTPHYEERRQVLSKINDYIETDILDNFNGDWKDYLNLYSNYKFSFCPISGNYNGLALRFYEALLVGCIPIQQVRKNTLEIYSKESNFNDCIFFENIEELSNKISSIKVEESTSRVWLEDELESLLLKDNLI